ncbi:MAG: LamG-like jellyroll fold domain-containing protein [Planctomycetota bacterium]
MRTPHKPVYPEGFVSARVDLSCRKICERVAARYEEANPGKRCGREQVLSVLVDNCLLERAEARELVEAWQTDSGATVKYRAEKRWRLQQVLYDELASCNMHLELRPDFEVQLAEPPRDDAATDQPVSEDAPEARGEANSPVGPKPDPGHHRRWTHSPRKMVVGVGVVIGLVAIGLGYRSGSTWRETVPPGTAFQVLAEPRTFEGKPPFVEVNAAVKADEPVLIHFWINPGEHQTQKARAVLGWGGFSTGYDDHVLLALPSDGSIRLNREQPRRDAEPGYVVSLGTGPAVVETDRWQHLALLFDPGLTVPVRLYLNGEPQALVVPAGGEVGWSWPGSLPASGVFFIGGREDFVELDNFSGKIGPVTLLQADEFTDDDVRREMERTVPGAGSRK